VFPVDQVPEKSLRIATIMVQNNPFGMAVMRGSNFARDILKDRNCKVDWISVPDFDPKKFEDVMHFPPHCPLAPSFSKDIRISPVNASVILSGAFPREDLISLRRRHPEASLYEAVRISSFICRILRIKLTVHTYSFTLFSC
jgi:hypothetical protein